MYAHPEKIDVPPTQYIPPTQQLQYFWNAILERPRRCFVPLIWLLFKAHHIFFTKENVVPSSQLDIPTHAMPSIMMRLKWTRHLNPMFG